MKWVAAAILVGALAIVLAIVLTRPHEDSGVEPGPYFGVTAGWCADHGGTYIPNDTAHGGPGIGTCGVPGVPEGS